MELYNACKNDDLLTDVSEIVFISSFSDLRFAMTSLSFTAFIDGKQFIPNPYLSEFSGQITFKCSNQGITANLHISLSEQFSNPEEAYEIYKKYDYLEFDSLYKQVLDNTQAGKIDISGNNHFNFSRMEMINIDHMIKLSKATFREMYKYLSNKERIESY